MIMAPSYPYPAPEIPDDVVGVLSPRGGAFCIDCAPISLWFFAPRRHPPKGWTKLYRRRAKRTCAMCGDKF